MLEVNGRSVSTIEAYNDAIEQAREQGKSNVLLAVRVGSRTSFVAAELDKKE